MSSGRTQQRLTRAGGTLALLATLVCASACSGSGTPYAASSATSSAPATTPVDLCTSLVGYWVKEALRGSKWAGIDWEQKGLSNERFEIHDNILAEARAEQKKKGTAAAEKLTDRRVHEECVQHNGATSSSENWREPTP